MHSAGGSLYIIPLLKIKARLPIGLVHRVLPPLQQPLMFYQPIMHVNQLSGEIPTWTPGVCMHSSFFPECLSPTSSAGNFLFRHLVG